VVGGFLLFLPGLATDFIGLIAVAFGLFAKFKGANLDARDDFKSDFGGYYKAEQSRQNGEIIDVEVIEESKTISKQE
ncbi:MAG: FxsA family protein, partial [Campylobacter sp.]|nr:FxsA family protein [Campylobacter sp.]